MHRNLRLHTSSSLLISLRGATSTPAAGRRKPRSRPFRLSHGGGARNLRRNGGRECQFLRTGSWPFGNPLHPPTIKFVQYPI